MQVFKIIFLSKTYQLYQLKDILDSLSDVEKMQSGSTEYFTDIVIHNKEFPILGLNCLLNVESNHFQF